MNKKFFALIKLNSEGEIVDISGIFSSIKKIDLQASKGCYIFPFPSNQLLITDKPLEPVFYYAINLDGELVKIDNHKNEVLFNELYFYSKED